MVRYIGLGEERKAFRRTIMRYVSGGTTKWSRVVSRSNRVDQSLNLSLEVGYVTEKRRINESNGLYTSINIDKVTKTCAMYQ